MPANWTLSCLLRQVNLCDALASTAARGGGGNRVCTARRLVSVPMGNGAGFPRGRFGNQRW